MFKLRRQKRDYVQKSVDLRNRINERAKLFVCDNIKTPTMLDLLLIESAMMVGAFRAKQIEAKYHGKSLRIINTM
jgi:hypothetical protein